MQLARVRRCGIGSTDETTEIEHGFAKRSRISVVSALERT
jgi:hypothetical protein